MNQELKNIFPKTWTAKILFALGCLIILVTLFYAEEDLGGMLDWGQYQRGWHAKGQKFEWTDFIPPAVSDDQNFAMSPVWIATIKHLVGNDAHKTAEVWYGDRVNDEDVAKFLALMPITPAALTGTDTPSQVNTPNFPLSWTSGRTSDLKPWQSYYRNMEKKNPAAEIRTTPDPQSPAADVLLALSKYDPAIEQLRRDSLLPYSRFPVQYDTGNPGDILLPHLAALKQCAIVLELRSLAELQIGRADLASDDTKLILRLADSVRTEPFIITHLVRMVIVQMAIQTIYEGLAEHQWTDAQLAGLDSELAKVDFPGDFQFSIQAECASDIKICNWFEQKRSRIQLLFEWIGQPFKAFSPAAIGFHLAPAGWFYQADLLRAECAQSWESAITNNDDGQPVISPDKVRQADYIEKAILKHHPWERMMTSDLTPFAKRTAFNQESVDLTRTAIALERYYLALGTYPNSLEALAPRFMNEVPPDIINGQPLHYRLTSDRQYVLYSLGWTERDDSGRTYAGNSAGNLDRGNWVWRYPTK